MGNIRYAVPPDTDFMMEYRLLYATHSKYEKDWNSYPHAHYFAELFFVADGEGTFCVEEETFPIRKNDLIVVNPNIVHTEYSSREHPLEYIVLGVERLCFRLEDHRQYLVFHNRESGGDNGNISFYFRTIQEEMSKEQEKYAQVCQYLLGALIIRLMRRTREKAELLPTEWVSRECSRARRFIDFNYQDEITLESLAAIAGLNKYYFAHAFTKYYGQSPMSYLNQKRITTSQELLVSTDMTVAAIASQCGFSSQSYFSQSFKKSCGQTPAEYRKKHMK